MVRERLQGSQIKTEEGEFLSGQIGREVEPFVIVVISTGGTHRKNEEYLRNLKEDGHLESGRS